MSKDKLLELYRRMFLIRTVEEAIAERYCEGKMRCPTHLCTGQEAVGAAVGLALRPDDFAVSTHRAHGHYLGKGGDLKAMLAEIYGKVTGCSRGKGGSMHLIDQRVGFMGSTAIVGGTIPVGVGLGLSIKLKKTEQVSCVFLGDGATEEGVFYESISFALLKKLPVLFICENNFYSVYSPLHVRQPEGRKIHDMVSGLGCPSEFGDGNDPVEVFEKVSHAVDALRQGKGPYFFEFTTYRWREHCGPNFDNDIGYRSEEEYLSWKKKDPVVAFRKMLVQDIKEAELGELENNIRRISDEAFAFAESSPFPSEDEIEKDVFTC